jgi:hypothetical protein
MCSIWLSLVIVLGVGCGGSTVAQLPDFPVSSW